MGFEVIYLIIRWFVCFKKLGVYLLVEWEFFLENNVGGRIDE